MRTLSQHIRDVFTLADRQQLLTEPPLSAEQVVWRAESCRFYGTVFVVFGAFWSAISVRELLRGEGDDTIVGSIGLVSAVGLVLLAVRYFRRARTNT